MKQLFLYSDKIIFLFLFSFSSSLLAQNFTSIDLNNPIEDKKSTEEKLLYQMIEKPSVVTTAIYSLIKNRCNLYKAESPIRFLFELLAPLNDDCVRASALLTKLINYQTFKNDKLKSGYISIYSQTLTRYMTERRTAVILKNIKNGLKKALNNSSFNFNLFHTVQDSLQSREASILFIAVLFQDVHSLQHIQYLKSFSQYKSFSVFQNNLTLLSESCKIMQQLLFDFTSENITHSNIELFPSDLHINAQTYRNLQPGLYHFYVPASLTILLKQYKLDHYESYIAPFLLNYIYEVIYNPNLKLSDWSTYALLLGEIEPKVSDFYKVKDIYLAHLGSLWALSPLFTPVPLNEFYFLAQTNMAKLIKITLKNL